MTSTLVEEDRNRVLELARRALHRNNPVGEDEATRVVQEMERRSDSYNRSLGVVFIVFLGTMMGLFNFALLVSSVAATVWMVVLVVDIAVLILIVLLYLDSKSNVNVMVRRHRLVGTVLRRNVVSPTRCSICLEPLGASVFQTECKHQFHPACIASAYSASQGHQCPLCRQTISRVVETPLREIVTNSCNTAGVTC